MISFHEDLEGAEGLGVEVLAVALNHALQVD